MALSSLYTPTPVEKSGNSKKRKQLVSEGSYDLFTKLLPLLQRKFQYGEQLQPELEDFLNQALFSLSPEGMQELANHYRSQVMGQGLQAGQNQAGQLKALGLSKGAQAGAMINAQNKATESANQYQMNMSSPLARMQSAQTGLNLVSQAQNPDLSGLSGLGGLVYNKPQLVKQKSGGLLGTLAGVAGTMTGMGMNLGQVFSGGGGGLTGAREQMFTGQIPYGG